MPLNKGLYDSSELAPFSVRRFSFCYICNTRHAMTLYHAYSYSYDSHQDIIITDRLELAKEECQAHYAMALANALIIWNEDSNPDDYAQLLKFPKVIAWDLVEGCLMFNTEDYFMGHYAIKSIELNARLYKPFVCEAL